MTMPRRVLIAVLLILAFGGSADAEVFVRWDWVQVPSPQSLGIQTLVVPAKSAALRSALEQGYRVYLEVETAALATFAPPARGLAGVMVKGQATPAQLRRLRRQLQPLGARVVALESRAKWPHIRTNWVTRNNDVLQVTGRSSQPWIENNAALLRIIAAAQSSAPTLSYPWVPITIADADEGPGLENYLVAIAEAGSFGADLVLPLHERFQTRLLLGQPQARAEWAEIRRYLEFYAWNLPARYEPLASLGVVTAEPMLSYEVMNLLARHNLPFKLVDPKAIAPRALDGIKLLIVLDAPAAAQDAIAAFERSGGTVRKVTGGVGDPNAFALEVRRSLGAAQRVIDTWNGITVIAAPFREPGGTSLLITALNYAHQPLPVQLRVPGTFSSVTFESPEEGSTLLPHQQRDGFTEFVLPALRVGGRVFLSR
jgi:hypothetical protein